MRFASSFAHMDSPVIHPEDARIRIRDSLGTGTPLHQVLSLPWYMGPGHMLADVLQSTSSCSEIGLRRKPCQYSVIISATLPRCLVLLQFVRHQPFVVSKTSIRCFLYHLRMNIGTGFPWHWPRQHIALHRPHRVYIGVHVTRFSVSMNRRQYYWRNISELCTLHVQPMMKCFCQMFSARSASFLTLRT